MSDQGYLTLLKRASYSGVGNTVGKVLTAVSVIIIARTVGPDDFGVYAAVLAVMAISFSFADLGIVTGLQRDASLSPDSRPQLLGNTVLIKLFLSLPILAIAGIAQAVFIDNPLALKLFAPLAISNLSLICIEPFSAILQVRGEQKDVSVILVFRSALLVSGVVILAGTGFGVAAMAWWQAFVSGITLLTAALLVIGRVSISSKLAQIPGQVRRSLAFGVSGVVYSLYVQAPLLVLARFATEAEVGYFAVAQRFVALCLLAGTTATNEAFLPELFGLYFNDRQEFRRVCAYMQRLFVAIGAFTSVCLAVFAEPIILLIQGEEYRPAVLVMQWMCWLVLIMFGTFAADSAMTAGKRLSTKISFQVVATVLTAGLAARLAPCYGVLGVTWAVLAGGAATAGLMGAYAYNNGLFSFEGMGRVLAASMLFLAVGAVVLKTVPAHPLVDFLTLFAAAALIGRFALRSALSPHGTPHTDSKAETCP